MTPAFFNGALIAAGDAETSNFQIDRNSLNYVWLSTDSKGKFGWKCDGHSERDRLQEDRGSWLKNLWSRNSWGDKHVLTAIQRGGGRDVTMHSLMVCDKDTMPTASMRDLPPTCKPTSGYTQALEAMRKVL